jgi:hypothetical protein
MHPKPGFHHVGGRAEVSGSMEIAEPAIADRDAGVVGFDIAGAEAGYPPTRNLDAFEYLRSPDERYLDDPAESLSGQRPGCTYWLYRDVLSL